MDTFKLTKQEIYDIFKKWCNEWDEFPDEFNMSFEDKNITAELYAENATENFIDYYNGVKNEK